MFNTILLIVFTLVSIGCFTVLVMMRAEVKEILKLKVSVGDGGSLLEIAQSLKTASELAKDVARELQINIAESRQQFSRLVVLLDQLQVESTASAESDVRVEAADAVVASDLAEAQQRARHAGPSPGMPADAAAAGSSVEKQAKARLIKKKKPKP